MIKVLVLFLAMVLVLSTFTACDIGPSTHRHTNIIDDAVAPTCTSTGLTAGAHCSECGEIIIKQEIVPVLSEHIYDDRYDAVCNVCGHTRDVGCQHLIIETLPAKEATCTETGLTAGKGCSVCGDSFATQQIIPAKGHTNGEWITDKEATETETGKKHQVCAVCGETLEVTVPVLGALEYTADGTSCTVTGIGSFTDAALYIPEYIDGHKVTAIGEKAFANQAQLTSIIIPDTVITIGTRAFYGCTGLTEITIPASVTSIGTQMLYKASNLSTVYYNSTYQNSDNPFLNLAHITKIVFGGKSIPSYILDGNTCVKEVVIADSVTSIGYSAFRDCSSLASIVIPDSVTSIDNDTFRGCSSLASIVIPDRVTSIGGWVFSGCSSLTSVKLPDSVTSISYAAFEDCSNLTSIVIPDSVTSIGDYAFWGCSSLTSIEIPDSVTSIDYGAFNGCSSLESIAVEQGNTVYHSAGNCLIETASKTLIAGCENSVIPTDGSVTSIGEHAFRYCSSLASIVIPDSVTSIGDYAFYECSSLTSIVIPDSVTSIGSCAFADCSSLTSIVIPDSVTSIGWSVFRNCIGLTRVKLPDSVTSIGDYAFSDCWSLTSITFEGTKAQWNAISKGSWWNRGAGDYTVHCTDGDITKY